MMAGMDWTAIVTAVIHAGPGAVGVFLLVRQNPKIKDIHKNTNGERMKLVQEIVALQEKLLDQTRCTAQEILELQARLAAKDKEV